MKFTGYRENQAALIRESEFNEELAWAEQKSIARSIVRRAKAHVHRVDGTMEDSIDSEEAGPRSIAVGVLHNLTRERDNQTSWNYAIPLEFGHVMKDGTVVDPRPFMRPAIEESVATLVDGEAVT